MPADRLFPPRETKCSSPRSSRATVNPCLHPGRESLLPLTDVASNGDTRRGSACATTISSKPSTPVKSSPLPKPHFGNPNRRSARSAVRQDESLNRISAACRRVSLRLSPPAHLHQPASPTIHSVWQREDVRRQATTQPPRIFRPTWLLAAGGVPRLRLRSPTGDFRNRRSPPRPAKLPSLEFGECLCVKPRPRPVLNPISSCGACFARRSRCRRSTCRPRDQSGFRDEPWGMYAIGVTLPVRGPTR